MELFEEIGTPITSIVEEQAKTCATEREAEFARFWARAWNAAAAKEVENVIGIGDPMTDALNHPAGKLAEAALSRLSKYKPGPERSCQHRCSLTLVRSPILRTDTSAG